MGRKCVIKTVSMPPEMVRLIQMAAKITGVSFSEFLRQAAIEKLERLGIISTAVKWTATLETLKKER